MNSTFRIPRLNAPSRINEGASSSAKADQGDQDRRPAGSNCPPSSGNFARDRSRSPVISSSAPLSRLAGENLKKHGHLKEYAFVDPGWVAYQAGITDPADQVGYDM